VSECANVLKESTTSTTSNGSDRPQPYRPFSLIQSDLLEPLLTEITTSSDFSLSRSSITDIYPTAPSQEALLAPSFDSPVGHYYAQAVYAIKTDIETSKLEQAIKLLIERHEVLRTVFVLPETLGKTVQVVLSKDDEQARRATTLEKLNVDSEGDFERRISVSQTFAFQSSPRVHLMRMFCLTELARTRSQAICFPMGTASRLFRTLLGQRKPTETRLESASRDEVCKTSSIFETSG